MTVRTSEADPLRVDWLPWGGPGGVGLTLAPGRKGPSTSTGGRWDRSLEKDLDRLVQVHAATHLVALIEDHELDIYRLGDLFGAAHARGLLVRRLPIPDGGTPKLGHVVDLCDWIQEATSCGRVVIHCIGGLGRSGTIAGCLLTETGLNPDEALETLRVVRGPRCPENAQQRRFISAYATARNARIATDRDEDC